jgi:hypothetical protein
VLTSSVIRALITFTTLMMEASSTSERSVNFYQTTRSNIQEDGHLHTHHLENLKKQLIFSFFVLFMFLALTVVK